MIYSQTKALSSCRPTPLYLILGDFSSPCLRPCNCTIEIVTACKTSHFSTIASFHRERLWLIHVKVIIMLFVLKIQLPRVWWGTPITRDWDRKIAIAVSSRPACSTWRRLISLGWRMELLLKNSYILVFHVWCIYSIDANAHKCIFFFNVQPLQCSLIVSFSKDVLKESWPWQSKIWNEMWRALKLTPATFLSVDKGQGQLLEFVQGDWLLQADESHQEAGWEFHYAT